MDHPNISHRRMGMPSSLLFISTVNNSKTIPFISGLNQVVRSPFSPFLDLNTHFWFYLFFSIQKFMSFLPMTFPVWLGIWLIIYHRWTWLCLKIYCFIIIFPKLAISLWYNVETTIINHPCGNGSSPTYKNGDDWGMVYDCFTNAIPFCLPQTRDIHSTQLLDCATVRQLRVPQAFASRAYWECTVCGNQLGTQI